MMSAAQQQQQAARLLAQQAARNARTAAQQQRDATNLAAQQAKYQHELDLRNTPVKRTSVGFNFDALGDPSAIDSLATTYDQVQFKNGNQSILLQRAGGGVTTRADVNQAGVLQVLPDVGPKQQAYQQAQVAAATNAKTIGNAQTPAWERYAVPVIGGVVLLLGSIMLLRRA